MDTVEVVRLLKDKDERGLTYLFDNYAAALNGIIRRIVLSEKLSEEILQQTFLKIWDKIDMYDVNKSTLFTWMSRIARNSAIDAKRLKKYENIQKTDSLDLSIHNRKSEYQPTEAIDVSTLMSKLDAKHKVVLDHIYLQGYSHSEAAEELDLPLGTVKTRLRNGLKELRKVIGDEKSLFLSLIFLISIFLVL